MNGILLRRITEARRRLIVHDFLHTYPPVLFWALTVLVVSRWATLVFFLSWNWIPAVALTLGAGFFVAALLAILRWHKAESVALEIDLRLPVQDRFSTGLKLAGNSPFDQLARKEIDIFAESQTMEALCPWKLPKSTAWIVLPLAVLLYVELWAEHRRTALEPELARARQMMEQAEMAATREAKNDPVLQEIAKELSDAAGKLSASPEPLREALRSLEEARQRAQAATISKPMDSAETTALANALAQSHPQLSENLRAGNNAEASNQIASLDPAELERALKEAERHVENSRLRDLARMPEGQAREQIVASLTQGGSGKNQKRFVSMVDDIKNGTSPSPEKEGDGKGDEEKANGQEQSASSSAQEKSDSGSPGSEKDLAQGDTLNKSSQEQNAESANDDFIPGKPDGGPSLIELYRQSGNDDAKARRAYRAAYGASAPAALDAIEQEDIPMGSRILVRRYFEAIRPKE